MDKKTIIIVVILGIIIVFFYPILEMLGLYKPPAPRPPQVQDTTSVDTLPPSAPGGAQAEMGEIGEVTTKPGVDSAEVVDSLPVDTITIETKYYTIQLSSLGGGPVSMELKEYRYRDDGNIEMLPEAEEATPNAEFAGGSFQTSQLAFRGSLESGSYDATRDTVELSYTYAAANGGTIRKTYFFYPDEYHYDLKFEVENTRAFGFERSYTLWWNTPLGVTEEQASADYSAMQAVTMQGGSREALEEYRDGGQLNQSLDGNTAWVGLRSKFFSSALIPRNREGQAATAEGSREQISTQDGKVEIRQITAGIVMPFASGENVSDSFTVYVGPMDYLRMDDYGVDLEAILDIGTMPFLGTFILKPFAIAIMWLLPKLHDFIPNYGLVIFVFAVLVKLITLPLTLKQFKSMQGMREISPKLEELRNRYKKDPQGLQRETMRLYKEHGVNPMSGCLVMLPQMPLMIAMFRVFQATILLRGEPFVWFVDDLSRGARSGGFLPDFTDPLIILVVIMVLAQLGSSIITMGNQPGQNKALVYVFPIMLGFFLYSLPSGLIIYWTAYSLLSFVDWFMFRRNKTKNPQVKTA